MPVTVITNMPMYQALVLASGLDLYAKTGMKPNAHYTPTRMLQAANRITGHNYRRGQYAFAAAALREWCETKRRKGETLQTPKPLESNSKAADKTL